jgi:hypothetical protein
MAKYDEAEVNDALSNLFEGTGAGRGVFDGLKVSNPFTPGFMDRQRTANAALSEATGVSDAKALELLGKLNSAADNTLGLKVSNPFDPKFMSRQQEANDRLSAATGISDAKVAQALKGVSDDMFSGTGKGRGVFDNLSLSNPFDSEFMSRQKDSNKALSDATGISDKKVMELLKRAGNGIVDGSRKVDKFYADSFRDAANAKPTAKSEEADINNVLATVLGLGQPGDAGSKAVRNFVDEEVFGNYDGKRKRQAAEEAAVFQGPPMLDEELAPHAPRPQFRGGAVVPGEEFFEYASMGKPATSVAAFGPKRSGSKESGNSKISGLGMEEIPGSSNSDNDGQVKGLRGLRGELDAAQKALTGRADAPMSTEETIGQMLVGILPGLLGLTVGGAVGGTTGALAGAGGGFGGSAEGLNLVNKNRREDRAKLVDRSEKLQARMDDLERQIGLRKDRLEDRDLSKTEAAKQRNQLKEVQNQHDKVAAEIESRRQTFTAGENSKDRSLQAILKSEELGQRERDSARDYGARMATAGAKGGELKEHQQKLAILLPTIDSAIKVANKLDGVGKKPSQAGAVSNFFNSIAPRSFESDDYRSYEDAATAFAQHYTFAVSGAQAPPEEVKRMRDIFFAKSGDSDEQRAAKVILRNNASKMISTLIQDPNEAREIFRKGGLPDVNLTPTSLADKYETGGSDTGGGRSTVNLTKKYETK